MTRGPALFELDADRMQELLAQLDDRLRTRGVKASLCVIGGAAMAMAYGREGLTPDIDAVVSHRAVLEETHQLAAEHALPGTWLNSNAGGWVPPRPSWARRRPTKLRLTVHIAPAEHLLAMKLIAGRRKDRRDIRLLIPRCGIVDTTAAGYADFLEHMYHGDGTRRRIDLVMCHCATDVEKGLRSPAVRADGEAQDRGSTSGPSRVGAGTASLRRPRPLFVVSSEGQLP